MKNFHTRDDSSKSVALLSLQMILIKIIFHIYIYIISKKLKQSTSDTPSIILYIDLPTHRRTLSEENLGFGFGFPSDIDQPPTADRRPPTADLRAWPEKRNQRSTRRRRSPLRSTPPPPTVAEARPAKQTAPASTRAATLSSSALSAKSPLPTSNRCKSTTKLAILRSLSTRPSSPISMPAPSPNRLSLALGFVAASRSNSCFSDFELFFSCSMLCPVAYRYGWWWLGSMRCDEALLWCVY